MHFRLERVVDRFEPTCFVIEETPVVVLREQCMQLGMEPLATMPEAFAAEIRESVARWPALINATGIHAQ
jgi:hypothetical protein